MNWWLLGEKFQIHPKSTCNSAHRSIVPGGIHQNRQARQLRSLSRGEPWMCGLQSVTSWRIYSHHVASTIFIRMNQLFNGYHESAIQRIYWYSKITWFNYLFKKYHDKLVNLHILHDVSQTCFVIAWRLLGVLLWLATTGQKYPAFQYDM